MYVNSRQGKQRGIEFSLSAALHLMHKVQFMKQGVVELKQEAVELNYDDLENTLDEVPPDNINPFSFETQPLKVSQEMDVEDDEHMLPFDDDDDDDLDVL
ncbi:hypothetical protein E3N88_11734 [Mikania micrantha]|uniref:Uncharacterized protein n=1 Tax=Mikania micrantha TaxID=192012 RepID=A0A5N6P6J2_9ASTR|nr:hypothetical protein E3N88_11734 [Mikania micrantha]